MSSAYNLIDFYQTVRHWLKILIDAKEFETLDTHLAAAMLARFGWWDDAEEKERVRIMRTKRSAG